MTALASVEDEPGPRVRESPLLILIIDDTPDLRETIGELLDERGYLTALAADGGAALEYLRSGAVPDLILLDLMMVGMDGLQFRAEQLRDPDLANIPVVVMTAMRPSNLGSLDVHRVVLKPFKIDVLLREIEAATQRHALN